MVLRRDFVDEVKIMPKQLHSAAVQTETVQLTEATTQTEAAMNLLAMPPPLLWPGTCSAVPRVKECSLPNPILKRSASSPPDFGLGRWRMRDSVPGTITYPERFEICRGIEIEMNTHVDGGLKTKNLKTKI